jgi:hypothetical protein
MKPYKSSEINSITMTHWWNGLFCMSKPSLNCWKFVREPHIFRWISSSDRKMAWLWDAVYHPSLATSTGSILRNCLSTRHNTNHHCSCSMLTHLWSGLSPEQLQNILNHLTSLRPSIQFTVGIESDSPISILDVLATKIYRKLVHTGWYLSLKFNCLLPVRRGLIQSLHNRTSANAKNSKICLTKLVAWVFSSMVITIIIDSVINSKRSTHPNLEEKSLGSMYILYVKGVSQKFKFIGNQYHITKHIVRSSLMKTRLERDLQQTSQCICSIPCECGRSYIDKTSRPLAMRLREHRHYLKEGVLE